MEEEVFRKILREELSAHDERMRKAVQVPLTDAMKRLKKSATTLWRWNKTGYLPRHKRGGRGVWYWEEDVRRIERDLAILNSEGGSDE